MAKIRVQNQAAARNAVIAWKTVPTADELLYDPTDFDGEELQLWAFRVHEVLINIQSELGPFKKIVFVDNV